MAQLKSTNITGNLAVTGNILASKIIKLGGTTHEVLLADGTVAKVSTTAQTVAPNAVTATAARTYIVQKNGDQLVVNVPWVKGESSGGTLTEVNLVGGDGITLSSNTIDSDDDSITISHADTSSQASMTTGGRTYINSITLDGHGHITALGTNTETVVDTGATSVEVTGTGNAITTASYDTETRKITLTKGSTFLTSHQSLAAYVQGPASATDNAITRFNGTGGKTVQNSTAIIDDTGNLALNNSSGGDISLELKRSSNADWRVLGNGGNLYFQNNWTTSKGSYYNVLSLNYNSGNVNVDKGTLTSKGGFIHGNLTAASGKTKNDYVLLAGGGTKAVSEIIASGSAGVDLTGYVTGTDLTDDTIILGNSNSQIKTSSKTITTSVGADDTTVPTSKAVKDYITGLGYITGSYLPLAGGTMTGAITLPENKMALKFRTHATSYETGLVYGTTGNEALTFAIQNPVTAFQIVYGTKPSAYGSNTWQTVTPLFQTKDGKVIINRKITATADTANLKLLDVNGDIGANGIFVNDITCSKILAPTASGGTTYGVGTNGQVLKSNGTTVYWGVDNSGLASLPTRLADYSTSGYGDANDATAQGWHYMTITGTNRPPFKQSSNKDYRIMSTAYSSSWVQQIATDFRGNDMFLRRKENGTWKPWTPIVRFQDCTTDHKMQTITDNAIPRWDTSGTAMLQNSTATISDGGHLNINTTSDTTMTTPAINVLHTGPANGSSTADLMILSGYNSAPYGFKFSTHGSGTAIIQSQRISGGSNEVFSLSLNPNGGDVLINGSKAATQSWVNGGYLPLSGGTMTGAIKYAGATREIISFAPDDATWRGGLKYSWSSNTTIGLWGKHVNSQFVWHAGTDFSTTDVNGTTTRTYDFQVGRDAKSGGSGKLEALLGGKPLATENWVSDNYVSRLQNADWLVSNWALPDTDTIKLQLVGTQNFTTTSNTGMDGFGYNGVYAYKNSLYSENSKVATQAWCSDNFDMIQSWVTENFEPKGSVDEPETEEPEQPPTVTKSLSVYLTRASTTADFEYISARATNLNTSVGSSGYLYELQSGQNYRAYVEYSGGSGTPTAESLNNANVGPLQDGGYFVVEPNASNNDISFKIKYDGLSVSIDFDIISSAFDD